MQHGYFCEIKQCIERSSGSSCIWKTSIYTTIEKKPFLPVIAINFLDHVHAPHLHQSLLDYIRPTYVRWVTSFPITFSMEQESFFFFLYCLSYHYLTQLYQLSIVVVCLSASITSDIRYSSIARVSCSYLGMYIPYTYAFIVQPAPPQCQQQQEQQKLFDVVTQILLKISR